MFNTLEKIFLSPLGSEFCDYYYYWTVFLLVAMFIITSANLWFFTSGKISLFSAVLSLLPSLFIYLHYRILYSMCSKVL